MGSNGRPSGLTFGVRQKKKLSVWNGDSLVRHGQSHISISVHPVSPELERRRRVQNALPQPPLRIGEMPVFLPEPAVEVVHIPRRCPSGHIGLAFLLLPR